MGFSKVSDESKAKLIEAFKVKGEFEDEDLKLYTDNQKTVLKKVLKMEQLRDLLDLPAEMNFPLKNKLSKCYTSLSANLSAKEIKIYMETHIGKHIEEKWIDYVIHHALLTTEKEFLKNNKRSRFTRQQWREFYRAINEN